MSEWRELQTPLAAEPRIPPRPQFKQPASRFPQPELGCGEDIASREPRLWK